MDKKINYALVRNVKLPVRGTSEAAGIDMFVPSLDAQFMYDLIAKNPNADVKYRIDGGTLVMTIMPGGRINIPSGVLFSFEPGSALIAANKSGVSTKKGLIFTCQVVDSDYDGEVHIGVANIGNEPQEIRTGDKLIQFLHTPVYLSSLCQVEASEIHASHTDSSRGDKGFGNCTGNN